MVDLQTLSTPPALPGAASPPLGGVLRVRPEDFVVHELPMYEPEDAGEHLYLRVRKIDCPHDDLIGLVARTYEVPRRAIGFAGMKDTRAVTEQTVSVHLPGGGDARSFDDERVHLVWAARHGNKLRRGHLAGNRFVIRIREVDPLQAPTVWRSMQTMEREGIPNVYGPQRFGRHGDNHLLGRAWLMGEFDAVAERLTSPERTGRFEGAVRTALADGATAEAALDSVPNRIRRLWMDALQSALFNAVLMDRLQDDSWNTLVVDDLAHSFRTRRTFVVSDADLQDEQTCDRVAAHELAATGPLWGGSMRAPGSSIEQRERAICDAVDPAIVERLLEDGPAGARRPLAVPLANTRVESGMDEEGPYMQVAFELPPGAYATTVLHAIMGPTSSS
jgi:tRNA pseudouridine13 synthase